MYKYVSSILRSSKMNTGYQAVNIANVKMFDLLEQYVEGYIELSNTTLVKNIYLSLDDIRQNKYPFTNTTFNAWLTSMGNKTIVGTTIKPVIRGGEVTFIDAFQGGFEVSRIHRNDSFSGNVYPRADLTDVYIQKTFSDLEYFQYNTLTTINGLLHLNIPREKGLQIIDAGKTQDVSLDNHVGVISFEQVGRIKQIPIKEEMMGEKNELYGYRTSMYVNLDTDLRNKTVLISIGGLLLGFDDLIDVINRDGLVRLNLHKLDLVDIVLNIKQYLNIKELDLEERTYKAQATRLEDIINSDEVIVELMSMSQTFFIIVDAQVVTMDHIVPNPTKLANTKELYYPNQYPYMTDKGLLLSYWKQWHYGQYTTVRRLYVKDTFYHHPVHDTGPLSDKDWVNNVDEITNVSFDGGRLLVIKNEQLFMETP